MFLNKVIRINSNTDLNIINQNNYHPFLVNYYLQNSDNKAELQKIIFNKLSNICPKTIINFVNQDLYLDYNPLNDEEILLEVFYINNSKECKIEYNKFSNTSEFHLKKGNFDFLCISSFDDSEDKFSNIFSQIDKSLKNYNHNFNNVFRQWNYIPNICSIINEDKFEYSKFNSVRKIYYDKDKLKSYPAATGIGISGNKAMIITFSINTDIKFHKIENSLQTSAYNYSDEIIKKENNNNQATPLFSRAIAINSALTNAIYLSGTASIRGEKTIGDSIISQMITTTDNINHLINPLNIKQQINKEIKLIKAEYLKIYMKTFDSIKIIKEHLNNSFPECDYFIVQADICRDDLLIEIEGVFGFI